MEIDPPSYYLPGEYTVAQFMLLAGIHVCPDPDNPKKDAKGEPIPGEFSNKTVIAGEVIESDTDLVTQHGRSKFQLVGGTTRPTTPAVVKAQVALPTSTPPAAAPTTRPDLDRLSLKDLQSYAEDNEIDLKGAKTRDEVLKIVKSTK